MLSSADYRLRADECLSAAGACADARLAREWRLMAAEWSRAAEEPAAFEAEDDAPPGPETARR